MNSPHSFMKRVLLVFVAIISLVVIGKILITPDSWGEYGYFRGDYIDEEAQKTMKYGTNISCVECHEEVYELKHKSSHKRLSCEICHSAVSDHVRDNKKFADMPTKQGDPQVEMCLNCHKKIEGRPEKFPMIDHKNHLDKHNVKSTHSCDQCHTVHAPLENINYVKRLRSMKEALNEN